MAYDIYLTESLTEAEGDEPFAQLSEELHGKLFDPNSSLSWLVNAPLLSRISDYYEDAVFSPLEIDRLLEEVRHVVSNSTGAPASLQKLVDLMIPVIAEAKRLEKGIIFVAD